MEDYRKLIRQDSNNFIDGEHVTLFSLHCGTCTRGPHSVQTAAKRGVQAGEGVIWRYVLRQGS